MNGLPRFRLFAVICVFLLSALFILVRYAALAAAGDDSDSATLASAQNRGEIVDRNGRLLAGDVRRYDIYVQPPLDKGNQVQVQTARAIATDLAPIMGIEAEGLFWRIANSPGEFVLGKSMDSSVAGAIRDAKDGSAAGTLSGVSAKPVPARVYPEKSLAGQILGFVGAQHQGLEGVEFALNAALSGRETDGRGSNVVLTIDVNVQHILEQVAFSVLNDTGAENVMFLAMDPRSGDILGSAVVPGFDPNSYGSSSPYLYRNLAALEHYEPGSVFKIFSIAAMLESGAISPDTEFYCSGTYERTFPGGEVVRITCADGVAHGRVTAREIITLSCNVGAAYAAEMYENEPFYGDLRNFGFGSSTGSWVNRETAGILNPPQSWSGRSRQSIAFGQEIAVSALQVMQAASVIANGGVLVPPRIVSHTVSPDGKTVTQRENTASASRRVISEKTAGMILSYMRDTATFLGTGWRSAMTDLNLAVKTGTSQILDSGGGYIASTVAILPAESPSLILYVVITRPQGETYGGRIAAPAIRIAAEQLVDYLGIPRGRNQVVNHSGQLALARETLPELAGTVPDFSGLSKRTLLPLLQRNDISVEILGEGWVRRQFPPPGSAVTQGMVLELDLE